MRKKILFLLLLCNSICASSFFELKTYLEHQLSYYQVNDQCSLVDSHAWIADSLNNNLPVPCSVFHDISFRVTLYRKFEKQLTKEAARQFATLKDEIMSDAYTYSRSAKDEIRQLSDRLFYYLSRGAEINRYPQRFEIKEMLLGLKKLSPDGQAVVQKMEDLFSRLSFLYRELRKPIEIINQLQAINYLASLNIKTIQDITLSHIRKMNAIFLKNILNDGGIFRSGPCHVEGYVSINSAPEEVTNNMKELIGWLSAHQEINPIKFAAEAHIKFLKIHPFVDGNKRTAMLLMNLILTLNGYQPFVMPSFHPDYLEYYRMIDNAIVKQNICDLYNMIVDQYTMDNLYKIDFTTCKRIGIFSGTFDPLHLGHDFVMRQILNEKKVDYIIIIPNDNNKSKIFKTDLELRRAMVYSVYKNSDSTHIISVYWGRDEIIKYLRKLNSSIKIVGIKGSDNSAAWNDQVCAKMYDDIEEWIIAMRDDGHGMHDVQVFGKPTSYIYPQKKISSTEVREKLNKEHVNWDDLPLHKEVIDYIRRTNLYRGRSTLQIVD